MREHWRGLQGSALRENTWRKSTEKGRSGSTWRGRGAVDTGKGQVRAGRLPGSEHLLGGGKVAENPQVRHPDGTRVHTQTPETHTR